MRVGRTRQPGGVVAFKSVWASKSVMRIPQSVCYARAMLDMEQIAALALSIGRKRFGAQVVKDVLIEPDVTAWGDDAVRVTFVVGDESVDRLTGRPRSRPGWICPGAWMRAGAASLQNCATRRPPNWRQRPMPILNVEHLLDQAVRLITTPSGGPRRQADLRRAISSVYYSVFHATLTAAGDAFVGRTLRASPRYALVYRGINHRDLRSLCEVAGKHPAPSKYRPFIPARGFGHDLRTFASAVIELQDARYDADYDPRLSVRTSDVTAAIELARTGLAHWIEAQADEKATFLTLLTFPPR
jgi:hypothetical protein